MNHLSSEQNINWRLVSSLIGLNAAIIISWIAYHNYQPILLKRLGYEHLTHLLGYSKLLVMATIPPLAGFLADRLRSQNSKKLPLLTAGVAITALIFMTVAATISPQQLLPLGQFLPVMIILWLISMNVFYAPALASMEEFVPIGKFSVVMGVFVLVSDLVYSLEPAIILMVDFLGASLTFITGGVLIAGFGVLFHRNYQNNQNPRIQHSEVTMGQTKHLLILIFGLALGFVIAYLMNVLPNYFNAKNIESTLGFKVELLISATLGLTAIAAFVISKFLKDDGRQRLFLISFLISLIALALCTLLPGMAALIGLLVLIPVLGILSITAFPIAISKASFNDKMFAAGLFIAGIEIPDSLLEILV